MLASSVASSFASCLETYEDLITLLAEPRCPYQDQVSQDGLQDELGRFKVWAGYVKKSDFHTNCLSDKL